MLEKIMNYKEVLELPIQERLAVIVNWIDNNTIEAAKVLLELFEFRVFEEKVLTEIEKRTDELVNKYNLIEEAK